MTIYKEKGERNEYTNNRGISLLRIPGKVYDRIITGQLDCTSQSDDGRGGFQKGKR